jgi:serine/threonine protein kinase
MNLLKNFKLLGMIAADPLPLNPKLLKTYDAIRYAHAPHIVNFYGACLKPRLCIVMEFCEQGSLFDVLSRSNTQIGMSPKRERNGIDLMKGWDKIFNWAIGIVSAIHSLHNCKPSIMHRDLKSLNVLVTADGTAKVIFYFYIFLYVIQTLGVRLWVVSL